MKRLIDYTVITEELFYKGWHILEYIEHNKLTPLDKEAICNSIMDALVYKGLIDPSSESLYLENLIIETNLEGYTYQVHPNITNIPIWMKEQLSKKVTQISASVPVSLFIAKPPSKFIRYCVYDPNYAVSSIFEEACFINCIYDSPTRPNTRLTEERPFLEVAINGELYLIDTITNRMFKSSWFKETYNMEIKSSIKKSEFNQEQKEKYADMMSCQRNSLPEQIPFYELNAQFKIPNLAETEYELQRSKKNFPKAWEDAELLKKDMEAYFAKIKK